ncbi:hypothetical protein ACNQGO_02975 [Flavobacterium sp. ZT3P35]|uniref:hypothetical protein n=1 Tax=Flavobacterium sp. ZT3P35 TaxID=3401727 RepID=UPI003AAA32D3
MKYRVATSSANLRDLPSANDNSTILAEIPFRLTFDLVDKTTADWWRVRLLNTDKEGFVCSNEIEPIDETSQKVSDIEIPNFEPSSNGTLENKVDTYKPLGQSTIPFRDMTTVASKKATINAIIEKLNVEKSFRYQKDEADTYCNIYTFDFCFFAKVYIPRLRWTDKAIVLLEKGNEVPLVFDDTVRPFYSNYIYDWFEQSSDIFGWEKIDDVDALQTKVNENGGVGIICAKRFILNKSGHVVVVVPETETEKAFRVNVKVIYPLQSQAGMNNYNYFSEIRGAWWDNKDPEKGYSSAIFFYHE